MKARNAHSSTESNPNPNPCYRKSCEFLIDHWIVYIMRPLKLVELS